MRTASSANTVGRRPGRDQRAEVEHEHPARRSCARLDVVLDEQDRGAALALHRRAASRRARRSRCGRARRRLVEQQQLRLGHQRPADLDQPARPEAQRLDRPVGDRVEPSRSSIAVGALVLVGGRPSERLSTSFQKRAGAERAPARRRAGARGRSCRRTARCAGTCARCPSRARRCVGTRVRSCAVERDRARRRACSMPSRQLKNVVLPAPFGPMSPTISPLVDVEADVVERGDAREPLRDARSPRAGSRRGLRAATGGGDVGGASASDRRSDASLPARRCSDRSGAGRRSSDLRFWNSSDALGVPGVGDRTEAEAG